MTPLDLVTAVIGVAFFASGMCFYASAVQSAKLGYVALAAILIPLGILLMAASAVNPHPIRAVLTHHST